MGKSLDKTPFLAEIQKRKIFEKRDIFIYLALLVLLLSLFLAFVVFRKEDSQGFSVTVDGKTILTHIYGQDFSVDESYKELIEIEDNDQSVFIKINFENGFNLLLVNEKEKTVKMNDSDCPSKNCTYMQAISSSGTIYCAPRKLKISPLVDSEFITITTGGQS